MSGVFRPVPGDPDIIWKTLVRTDKGDYYAAVMAVHGTTAGDAHLCIWSPNHDLLHRAKTHYHLNGLTGLDRDGEVEWDSEITKVLQHREYRRVEKE